MIRSMTGFGVATAENDKITVKAEVKSLNSKFMDLSLRLPREFADREIECRNYLTSTVERGKVSANVEIQYKADPRSNVIVREELVRTYYNKLSTLADQLGTTREGLYTYILQLPNVVENDTSAKDNTEEWQLVFKTFKEAIQKCDAFRVAEGKTLREKFLEYLNNIEAYLKKVEELDPLRIANLRTRISAQFEEYKINESVDKNRFEQELIYYIEKLDISEEKVRLKSHLDYFRQTMDSEESNGKKLGFIAQEIGREINTIGSKANEAEIQRSVVCMKDELEKIKEQVLNII